MPAAYEIADAVKCAAAHEGFISFHIRPSRIFHDLRQQIISYCEAIFHYIMERFNEKNKLVDLSLDLSVQILKFCESIKGHYSLVNQLERSATSIGANIHEANYAHGKADFASKLQITLKECYETEYWLTLFAKAGIAEMETVKRLQNQCGTIRRILIASINTVKSNRSERQNYNPPSVDETPNW